MTQHLTAIAQTCLDAAETGALTFPEIVGKLIAAGFESYAIDFRRATATYYLPDGAHIELTMPRPAQTVAESFDAAKIQSAIKEAQTLAPGYTYPGFCAKVMAAGCAGYTVSFLGKRALYFGRTGETHTELFPQPA